MLRNLRIKIHSKPLNNKTVETEAKKIGMKLTEATGLTWEEVQKRIKG